MGLFSTKKIEGKDEAVAAPNVEATPGPGSITRVAGAPPAPSTKVGIDHAIQLMRSLPTGENMTLVVKVLKTTLESLGIRIADIVADATQRQRDIEGRVTQLKSEISALEKEVDVRVQEITKLEASHTETTTVKEYLESEEIEV